MANDSPVRRSKVARVIETYDLAGLGDDLEHQWTRSEDRKSLRELATTVNHRILEAAMREAGRTVNQHDVEHVYTLLTDDDVSEGARIQTRRELERDGVDVAELERDFVTHQAVHTYLRDFRGASHEPTEREPVESAHETLERLRSRTVAVSQQTVERLRDAGHVTAGDLDVYVEIRVHCEDCGTDQDVATFLEGGGCQCLDA